MLKCGWGLGVALVVVGCTEVVLPLSVKIERVPPNPREMEQEAFALHTSRHLTFYEGVMHELKPGRWTRLEVKLGLRDWRSDESDATRIKKTNDVRMLSLLVFNGMLNATLYMDNFTWDHMKKGEKKKLE